MPQENLIEFLENINHAKTIDEAWRIATIFFKRFGANWAIYAYAEKPEKLTDPVKMTPPLATYTDEWMAHYTRQNYVNHDFTAKHCLEHLTPIRMGIDLAPRDRLSPTEWRIVTEGREMYGHRSGIVFPTRWSGYRGIGGIGLASSLPGVEFEKILAEHETLLYAAAQALHAQLRLLEVGSVGRRHVRLRPRERDILRLVAVGYSNPDIAEALGITEATVKKYLSDIFRILDVGDRTHAVVLAALRGLIDLSD